MCPKPEEARAVIRSSHGSTLLRRFLIGAIVLLVPVLAGCEAGDNAPTLEFHPAANGASSTAGPISIDDAFILGGPDDTPLAVGSSASMFLYAYNAGDSADKLVSASAPDAATSVQLAGGSIVLPAQSAARLTGPVPKLVLTGLTRPLTGGQTVTVLLTFQNAGAISLTVPVEARSTYYASYLPPAPSASPAKSVKAGATATPTPTLGASAQPSATPSATP
jgi:copper(I)-binding protein